MSDVDLAVAAIRSGDPVVLPFDTVYGLVANPSETAVRALYALKGRKERRPTALVAADVEQLVAELPELPDAALTLLPGPVTLVVPNSERRFPWLTGGNPGSIGVRVPVLHEPTAQIVRAAGVVVATSANHPGGPDPRRLDDVPADIRAGAGAVLDAGELPGTPSTVIDLTGTEPRILREGALPAAEALRRLGAAVRSDDSCTATRPPDRPADG
jgi:L-threonylcarbamoyladenylate synthase